MILNDIITKNESLLIQPGYINYFLFRFAQRLNPKYKNFRNYIGELECAKRELKRRCGNHNAVAIMIQKVIDKIYDDLVAPYEDKKIEENGDV